MMIVFRELYSFGEQPYPGKSNVETSEYVMAGNRLSRPEKCPEEIFKIIQQCWQERTKDRPSMRDIHTELRKLLPSSEQDVSNTNEQKPDEFYVLSDDPDAFYE